MGTWVITAPPEIEPVSLSEAKAHLNVTDDTDDTLITALIVAAREVVERLTRRAFLEQACTLYLDEWPEYPLRHGIIEIPRPPLLSVDSVKYYDTAGTLQTLSAADYQVDTKSEPARISPAYGKSWPTVQSSRLNAIELAYTCGYGDEATDVPQRIKQAIFLLIGHWYANREEIVTGMTVTQVPWAANAIITALAV